MGLGKSHIPSHLNPNPNPIYPIPFAIIPFQSQIPIPYPIFHLPYPIPYPINFLYTVLIHSICPIFHVKSCDIKLCYMKFPKKEIFVSQKKEKMNFWLHMYSRKGNYFADHATY